RPEVARRAREGSLFLARRRAPFARRASGAAGPHAPVRVVLGRRADYDWVQMPPPLPQEQQMFDAFRRLRTEWPRRGWSWDSRLSCIASSFSADMEATARAIAMTAFPNEWIGRTLPTAPANVQDLADRCGGLR